MVSSMSFSEDDNDDDDQFEITKEQDFQMSYKVNGLSVTNIAQMSTLNDWFNESELPQYGDNTIYSTNFILKNKGRHKGNAGVLDKNGKMV